MKKTNKNKKTIQIKAQNFGWPSLLLLLHLRNGKSCRFGKVGN